MQSAQPCTQAAHASLPASPWQRCLPRRGPGGDAGTIHIGLVNIMPDGALLDTERQFRQLAAASGNLPVRVSLFTIPGIQRSAQAAAHLREHYGTLAGLRSSRLDALIVTGTEPRAADLTQEPFWPALTEVLDWAQANTVSTLVSCLAAHAAVLHFDGLKRQRLAEKCCGVFDISRTGDHPLTAGAPAAWRAVHSRRYDIDEASLRAHGYNVLARNAQAGVHLFARGGRNLLVGLQGHPEYERDTILLEYRRDIGRFLRREQDSYPAMPRQYFDRDTEHLLSGFAARARSQRDPAVLASFPNAAAGIAGPWPLAAPDIFRNWLLDIDARKARLSFRRAAIAAWA